MSFKKQLLAVALIIILFTSLHHLSAAPTNFQNETLITNLNQPAALAFTPDGRMLILERSGAIKVVQPGATQPDPTPFLQLTNIVSDQERGALGLALDPNFATNNFYYVFYSASSPFRNRVSRFTASGNTTNLATELVLWQNIVAPDIWHMGGTIAFGPDQRLYISAGDNLTAANSPSLASYSGKILRINSDGSIPTDNPFYDGAGPNLDAIWARGLRNPFRISWDNVSSKMYIGDVGQNNTEEINIGVAGANYGWPTCEGSCGDAGMTNPIYSYSHGADGASIIGGFVYRGSQFPASYVGTYFFADYAMSWIKQAVFNPDGSVNSVNNFEPLNGSSGGPYGDIVDLKQGPDGALYYVDIGLANDGSISPGTIHRIRYTAVNQPPTAVATSTPTSGPAPLSVNFSSAGSADPESQPLSYTWTFGDNSTSTLANPNHVYSGEGMYQVRLSVSDGVNSTLSNPFTVVVGNPPTPSITSPVAASTYTAGQTILYSGTASDTEDGALPPSALTWNIVFHHDTHVHPVAGPLAGISNGSFVIPSSGHPADGNTSYEILLTATDSTGVQNTRSVFIYPQKINLTFNTIPANLPITIDGISHVTPYVYSTLIGFQHDLGAPNQANYTFSSWSDSGAQSHPITVPNSAQTYTASFSTVTAPPPLDNFDRATLGPNWTVVGGTPTINQNTVAGNSTNENIAFWNASTFSADQFSEAQVTSLGDVNHEVQLNVRLQSNQNRYGVFVTNGNNPVVYKRAPNYSELGPVPTTVVPGDTLRLEAEGSTLRVKKNGALVATFTDSSLTTGSPGFNLWNGAAPNATNRIDNWSGGNLGAPDSLAPTVSITAPTQNEIVTGTIAISGTAADNVGVAGVQFKLDGANLNTEVTAPPYSISWNTVTVVNGPHALTAVARDAAGNTTTSSVVNVTVSNQVDTTPPVISNIASTNITQSGAVISWNTDEFSDSQVEYGTTASYGLQTTIDSSQVLSHSQTLSSLSPSTLYHYRVKSRDAALNLAVSTDKTFTTLAVPPGPTPVLSYKFQEGATILTADGSGNGATGTLTNGAAWTTGGKYANAISFDGTDDYVTTPDKNSLDVGANGTIEAWVKPTTLSRWNSILAKGNANNNSAHNYAIEITNANKFICMIGNGSGNKTVNSTTSATLNQFTHVACVWNGTNLQLYINGVLNTSTSQGITPAGNTSPLYVAQFGGNADRFKGIIDEVRIYNQALTQPQVQSDMNTPL